MKKYFRIAALALLLLLPVSIWWLSAQSPLPSPQALDWPTFDQNLQLQGQQHQWQAFSEQLTLRRKQLDSLCIDSTANNNLAVQQLQQAVWESHYAMKFGNYPQASKTAKAAINFGEESLSKNKSNKAKNDSLLLLLAEAQANYALLYAGAVVYDKDFKPLITADTASLYLRLAQANAAKVQDKKSLICNELMAFLQFANCRHAIANNQFDRAISEGEKSIAFVEKYNLALSPVFGVDFYKHDFYINTAWAMYQDNRDIEAALKPLHIALLQISYSDSTRRAQAITDVRSGALNSKNFAVPFDSISNKIAADGITAAKMHGLEDWLINQPENIKAIYYPIAFKSAEIRTQILGYSSQQMQRMFDKQIVLKNLYYCYETAIALANEMHRRTGQKDYLQKATHWMENMRATFLVSNLYENNRQKFAGIPDSLVAAFAQLQQKIVYFEQAAISSHLGKSNNYSDSLRQARLDLDQLLAIFKKDYPRYYALQNKPALPNFDEIREQLGDSTTLLQFYEGGRNVYIFSIHKDTMSLRAYPRTPYNNLLSSLIVQCTKPDLNDSLPKMVAKFGQDGYNFYSQYISENIPVATKRLIVIADGNLHYLPLEALCYDSLSPAVRNFSQLPYLVRKYSISYQYAMSLWYEQQKTPTTPINVQTLAMAADYKVNNLQALTEDNEKAQIMRSFRADDVRRLRPLLSPLKGVTLEIEALSDKYRGVFYTGEEANEAEFKQIAPYYGILHLAMHSVVNEENPSRSSLAFTETLDTTEDNFLMAYEIKQMQLNSALVVLSACETGYGKYAHGEGVLSVGNSFMYAGSRSLITTLWQLNDQTAPPIILDFYAQLQTKIDKDEALRKAKLAFLDNNSSLAAHPAFWACFVQVGDYSPLIMSERIQIWWYLLPVGFVVLIGWWARRALRQRRKF
jgi:CHAT domain-containing protein